ncbi:hypothetical protein ILYODFUR_002038 [Ilyodon furcidens]|uniref:Secreted protein n=1 Tax=Ilyodon furcidens TaxID=33524 RepID=A0ABV0SJV7_9TELE
MKRIYCAHIELVLTFLLVSWIKVSSVRHLESRKLFYNLTFSLLYNLIPDVPAVLLGLHEAVCSPQTSEAFTCCSWIYTEIKLHTGGLHFTHQVTSELVV